MFQMMEQDKNLREEFKKWRCAIYPIKSSGNDHKDAQQLRRRMDEHKGEFHQKSYMI